MNSIPPRAVLLAIYFFVQLFFLGGGLSSFIGGTLLMAEKGEDGERVYIMYMNRNEIMNRYLRTQKTGERCIVGKIDM